MRGNWLEHLKLYSKLNHNEIDYIQNNICYSNSSDYCCSLTEYFAISLIDKEGNELIDFEYLVKGDAVRINRLCDGIKALTNKYYGENWYYKLHEQNIINLSQYDSLQEVHGAYNIKENTEGILTIEAFNYYGDLVLDALYDIKIEQFTINYLEVNGIELYNS